MPSFSTALGRGAVEFPSPALYPASHRAPSLALLNVLLAFEAAGRLGSMARAGAELGVTHGAVSRQVGHLEAALGAAFSRGRNTGSRSPPRDARSSAT